MSHFSRGKGERRKKKISKTLLKEEENKKVADCDKKSIKLKRISIARSELEEERLLLFSDIP